MGLLGVDATFAMSILDRFESGILHLKIGVTMRINRESLRGIKSTKTKNRDIQTVYKHLDYPYVSEDRDTFVDMKSGAKYKVRYDGAWVRITKKKGRTRHV